MLRSYHNRTKKPVNENFFDAISEKTDYILGAFYSCYRLSIGYKGRANLMFKSRYKKLVEIVRDEIFPNHSITSDNRKGKSSNWIAAASLQKMHSRLEELGLNVLKEEREFPENIPEERLYNVVRGFIDAEAAVNSKKNEIRIGFYNKFLLGLDKALIEHAGVNGGALKNKELLYKKDDAIKIYDFIYQNFELIKKHGLYLREKKEAFYKFITKKPKVHYKNIRRHKKKIERIELAKKLLEEGLKVKDIAKKVGYAYPTRLCNSFKEVTGFCPTEYKRAIKGKKTEES